MKQPSKQRFSPILFVAALLCTATVPLFAQPKPEVERTAPLTVTATGTASSEILPDTAILRFGVEIRDPSTTQAVQTNQRMTARIVDALEKAKVTGVSVAPYEMSYVPSVFVPALGTNQPVEFRIQQKGSYKVTSDIVVTLHTMKLVPKVIELALTAGVDRIDAVQYSSSQYSEVARSLLPRALADALSRAKALAASSGMILGPPLKVASVQARQTGGRAVLVANGQGTRYSPPKLTVESEVRVVYRAKRAS